MAHTLSISGVVDFGGGTATLIGIGIHHNAAQGGYAVEVRTVGGIHRIIAAARRIIEEWRIDYNEHRTPNEFATRSRSYHNENRVKL